MNTGRLSLHFIENPSSRSTDKGMQGGTEGPHHHLRFHGYTEGAG